MQFVTKPIHKMLYGIRGMAIKGVECLSSPLNLSHLTVFSLHPLRKEFNAPYLCVLHILREIKRVL